MKICGIILGLVGCLIMLIGYGMSGAAEYSDTLNIGLLNDKSNAVVAGGFVALSGAVIFSASQIIDAVRGVKHL